MFLTDPGPGHLYSTFAGQTLPWSGTDNRDVFLKNCADPEKFELVKQLGWDQPDCITYQYNAQGFRSPEFESGPAGLALGCSFTMGIGLPIEKVWPSVLGNMLDKRIWNLGVGGAAMDTVFRLVDFYIEELHPEFVAILTPPPWRFEYVTVNNLYKVALIKNETQWESMFSPYIKAWMLAEQNATILFKKNLLAIQQICHQHNTPLYYVCVHQTELDTLARDLAHAGVEWQTRMAQDFFEQITKKDNK